VQDRQRKENESPAGHRSGKKGKPGPRREGSTKKGGRDRIAKSLPAERKIVKKVRIKR